jgi:hypothetical protein
MKIEYNNNNENNNIEIIKDYFNNNKEELPKDLQLFLKKKKLYHYIKQFFYSKYDDLEGYFIFFIKTVYNVKFFYKNQTYNDNDKNNDIYIIKNVQFYYSFFPLIPNRKLFNKQFTLEKGKYYIFINGVHVSLNTCDENNRRIEFELNNTHCKMINKVNIEYDLQHCFIKYFQNSNYQLKSKKLEEKFLLNQYYKHDGKNPTVFIYKNTYSDNIVNKKKSKFYIK